MVMTSEFKARMEGPARHGAGHGESLPERVDSTIRSAVDEVRQAAQRHPFWILGTVAAFAVIAVAIVKRDALMPPRFRQR